MLDDFLKYQAKTTPHPLGLEIEYASGSYLYDTKGKSYLDFVAGVSALPLGHSHPKVVAAVKSQIEKYMHVMVYGEFVQAPAVKLCKELLRLLPKNQETVYLTNSGGSTFIEGKEHKPEEDQPILFTGEHYLQLPKKERRIVLVATIFPLDEKNLNLLKIPYLDV